MPRFVIIDNWLDAVGGHNYQYAVEILQAAAASGYEPVLATASAFSSRDALPSDWILRPLFPFGWSRTHTVGVDGKRNWGIDIDGGLLSRSSKDDNPDAYPGAVNKLLDTARRRDRGRRIRGFRDACARLFDEIGFDSDDAVFLPSVSDFDFLGLMRFLVDCPQSEAVDWHVQFHYDVFDGRLPEHVNQESRHAMLRRQFSDALEQIPNHRLHQYATTPQIADQYNLLEMGRVQPLPYPVSNAFLESTSDGSPSFRLKAAATDRPLRVTMAGGSRREKGKHGLTEMFQQIDRRCDLGRDVQLWIQGSSKVLAKYIPDELSNTAIRGHIDSRPTEAIVVVEHPLERDDYIDLIQRSDIALLPYNSARYHARASGVLVEMLAAGVPVIVPAGCWLAAQIADSGYAHLDNLLVTDWETSQTVQPDWTAVIANKCEQQAHAAGSQDAITLGGSNQPSTTEVPIVSHTNELIVSLEWREQRPGYFVRITAEQIDSSGTHVGEPQEVILGERTTDGPIAAMFHLSPQATTVRLTLSNAYHDDSITMGQPECLFFRGAAEGTPTSAVGLIAADLSQIPELLAEMTAHFEHFQATALDFSETWKHDHAPLRTVEAVTANVKSLDNSADLPHLSPHRLATA